MDDSLVTIATYMFTLRAYLTKGRLESEGIECFIFNENFRYGLHVNLEDGIELKVRKKDYDKAIEILENIKIEFGDDVIKDHTIQVKKILVPVDFSDSTENSCEYALDLAELFSAEISLFHSYHLPNLDLVSINETGVYSATLDEHLSELKSDAESSMNDLLDLVEGKIDSRGLKGKVKVVSKLVQGIADDEILYYYRGYHPDIIIMGTGLNKETGSKAHNSISAEIIENVKVPVLAVPADSVKSLKSIKNIMYITNFDDSDFRAIHKLIYLLSPFKVNIHCVHISGAKDKWDDLKLDGLKEHLRRELISSDIEIGNIQSSDILAGTNKYIANNNIDIVALISHKRNLISRLIKPGLPRKILIDTKTPVLAFH